MTRGERRRAQVLEAELLKGASQRQAADAGDEGAAKLRGHPVFADCNRALAQLLGHEVYPEAEVAG